MKRALVVLGLLSLAGIAGGATAASLADTAAPAALRYLALGDSYTIGEGAEPPDRWPVQLAGLLRQRRIQVEGPQIIARTGWTVAELDRGIDAAMLGGPYDLVTLLIGVNDQYRGSDPKTYRTGFARMLARAVALAGGDAPRVIVLSIPDWGITPFARRSGRDPAQISAAIDRFNEVNRQESLKAGVRFVDITPVSRRALSEPSLLAPDGLHYSGPMYLEWARLALPVVADAISTRPPSTPLVRSPQIRK